MNSFFLFNLQNEFSRALTQLEEKKVQNDLEITKLREKLQKTMDELVSY